MKNAVPIRDLLERDGLIFGKKIEHLHTYEKVQVFFFFFEAGDKLQPC